VRSVRWIWGQRIVIAWILTLPCSAFMAGVTYFVVTHMGIGVTLTMMAAGCIAIWLYKRRQSAIEAISDAPVTSISPNRPTSTHASTV